MGAGTPDEAVMDVLRTTRSASVAEIAARLDVTEATVRRKLHRLEHEGLLIRTYGGAVIADGRPRSGAETDPQLRYKRAIGAAASHLVADGSTIALSSGSTVLELARRLRDRSLTVITNVLDIANALLDARDIELVVVGGVVLPDMHSMRGHLTEEALRDLRADRVFMGASAIDLDNGFMTEQVQEISVDRAMRRIARDAVILADATKFDRMAPGFMFGFQQIGTIVTDDRIEPDTRLDLEARGVRVVVGAAND